MKKKIEKDDNFDIISDESFLASGEHKLVIAAVNRGFATAAVEEARRCEIKIVVFPFETLKKLS